MSTLHPSIACSADLPKNPKVLAALLSTSQEVLCVIAGIEQRLAFASEALSKLSNEPNSFLTDPPLVIAVAQEGNRQFARGIPPLGVMTRYLDARLVAPVLSEGNAAIEGLMDLPRPPSCDREAQDWARAIDRLVQAQRALATVLHTFQANVITALDRADTSADTVLKSAKPPNDSRALKLYFELLRNSDPDRSETSIAQDFVCVHGGNPQSLLKAVRRFRKRLQAADG